MKIAPKAQQLIVAFVDAPDPDNLVQLIALHRLNPSATVHVALTGRPVRFNASKRHALWDWDYESARMVQTVSALRIKNFLQHFGVGKVRVFDGGIAPRTPVPHRLHFPEYYKFGDVDPLQALRKSQLEPQESLIKIMLKQPAASIAVAVGGPMTGLHQLIVRCPQVATRLRELHAMFATWGTVALMQLDDTPRGATQFNAVCDPQAAHAILRGLTCPIYLMPTDVTRVKEIGFASPADLRQAIPDNAGSRATVDLYKIWYAEEVQPRQAADANELIFIHDLVAALSLDSQLRQAIYNVVPVEITDVPHLPNESERWGQVLMKKVETPSNIYAATSLTAGGPEAYRAALQRIFA